MVSLLPTKFHEILFSSFRGVALTDKFCFQEIVIFRFMKFCSVVSFDKLKFNFRGISPTTCRGSTFPGNMHNYIWCPYYLPSFMKFCSVVSEELC